MVWLIGNKGMLGTDVESLLQSTGISYYATDRDVDITNYNALCDFIENKNIKWIVNCSAYTAVDKAEDDKELCYAINRDGVANIAKLASKNNCKLIHISTDYVFDGSKDSEYLENDITGPLGVYGESKLAGEKAIIENMNSFYVVRTAWLYGKNGGNFVHTMLRLFNERDELNIVSDQYGSPTYSIDLANFILCIIERDNNKFGVYHYSNEGKTNWYEFACKIYEIGKETGKLKKDVVLNPVTTDKYPTKAKRPMYSLLSKEKVKSIFDLEVPEWRDSLERFINELG